MGLDRGGSCRGMAFKVAGAQHSETLDYLRGRELVTDVYRETIRPAVLEDGETVSCVTYLARRNHDQYAGKLDHDALVERIARSHGQSGDNRSYFLSTIKQLRNMGIRDRVLEKIADDLSD